MAKSKKIIRTRVIGAKGAKGARAGGMRGARVRRRVRRYSNMKEVPSGAERGSRMAMRGVRPVKGVRGVGRPVKGSYGPLSGEPKKYSSLGARILISLLAIALVVVLGIFVQNSFSGKAIDTPQAEAVDFDAMESEQILVDVNTIDFTATLSEEMLPTRMRLSMSLVEEDQVRYLVRKLGANNGPGIVVAEGLLGGEVLGVDEVFVNDDDAADLALVLEGPYLRVINLNYETPEAAVITRVRHDTQAIADERVIQVAARREVAAMFHINSTVLPSVAVEWQNGSEVVEAEIVGGNESSVLLAINWTPAVGRGSFPFTILAQVDQEYSEKRYVMAVGGVEYSLLNNDGSVRMEMFRENGQLKAHYVLAPSNGLVPLMAPCAGFPGLGTLSNKIITVYGYNSGPQQWRSGVPSEFGVLDSGVGYLVRLKEGEGLDVTYVCANPAGNPDQQFALPRLRPGWNLISFSGSSVREARVLNTPVGTQIRQVFEVTPQRMVPDAPLEVLEPGRVYWVKVQ